MLLALTLLALASVKASAQSPPWRRKPSPAATRLRAFFKLRASPANTSGGNVARRRSTEASASRSGYSGTCATGLWRQLSRVQRSGMTPSTPLKPWYGRDFPIQASLYTTPGAPSQIELPERTRSNPNAALFRRLAPIGEGFLPQRHELLGGGRMHRHDRVDVGLGRLHLHRDADELDHFAGVRPHNVAADDASALAVDDELEERARIAGRERHLQRPERSLVHVDLCQLLAGLRLGQPDRANLGLGEHGSRHIGVIDRGRFAAEYGIGESVALADCDRR